MINIVEFLEPDHAFDQPCKFGHRCGDHAVYCHNKTWAEAPRKCRRTWYTSGREKDEDCPGYEPNPNKTEAKKKRSAEGAGDE